MKQILAHILAGVLVLLAAAGPATGEAQETPQGGAIYTAEQLDQLLAPIALYPDALLSQVLMAATYPLEVVEAARWVHDPHNAALKGDALTAALAGKDWAPSVKSLVPFPQVLQMMDDHLDWMQKLGDAFLAQESDVMNAVQRLRSRAMAAGTLQSTEQQRVAAQGQTIEIEPANPAVIYVPVYDPLLVYGVWPYPVYPPYYFPPPPGYIVEPTLITGFYFTAGIITVNWLWGWGHFDWPRHRIHVDVHRYNVINVHRPPITRNIWVHNHYHRRGVPYPNAAVRDRFEHMRPGAPATRREFRGYEPGQRIIRPITPPKAGPPPRQAPRAAPPRTFVPQTPPRGQSSHFAPSRPLPPAFQSYSHGSEVRRDAERGRASRETMSSGKFAPSRPIAPPRGGQVPGPGGTIHGKPGGGGAFGGERRR